MYKIATLNKISPVGLAEFSDQYEIIGETDKADGIVVRSQNMKEMTFSDDLLCIARAGVGVNNIPIDKCTEAGIAVFNTPGANANAVKEMIIAAMLLASRDIIGRIHLVCRPYRRYRKSGRKGKSQFKGCEIMGKTLGVIGLGGIGVPVANAASALGMKVYGYDAYLSVRNALHITDKVHVVEKLDDMLPECDFLTVHVHANDSTNGMINADTFSKMKDHSVLLNYARASIVDTPSLKEALESGKLRKYVTDFPNEDISGLPNVILTPHLGASTVEAEDNCAVMAVEQMMDYIENGNITNSVNFPACNMGVCQKANRLALFHKNIPNTIAQVTNAITELNISDMMNKSLGGYAYTLIDLDSPVSAKTIEELNTINGLIRVRVI